jgi:glyoxylase-like metal-dependent hydrolase (beta-lactamase superfamily II)
MHPRVTTIDCRYLAPEFAAAYLLTEGRQAAFIDNNTAHSVPLLMDALARAGLDPEDVRYVIITHVHLDHAGGTSELMRLCPNATLLAHPRAARHMIDPAKLVASAKHVYGEENFRKLYGEINPVPAARVRSLEEGETAEFGANKLRFLHTRGHANHHFCVRDEATGEIFTGDAFGLCYPALQARRGLFIFPSTSPTDFDAEEARKSVNRIAASGAPCAWLTHFGGVTRVADAAKQLLEHLDFSESVLAEAVKAPLPDAELTDFCEEKIHAHFKKLAEDRGAPWSAREWELLKLDLELNAQGLAYVATKKRMS